MPLCVISRGQYPEKKAELTEKQKLVERLQAELATRSTKSKHFVCQPGTRPFYSPSAPKGSRERNPLAYWLNMALT